MIRSTFSFLVQERRWLFAGFLLTLGSSFGQTFFISLSGDPLRAQFGLSHAGWGSVYMIATLASAIALTLVGGAADHFRTRTLTMFVLAGFGLACLSMATLDSVIVLVLTVFALRFCGQGMMSHLASTAMARWYDSQRGRAVAFSAFGYPLGEATAPFFFVAIAGMASWQLGWGLAAFILMCVLAPLIWLLLRSERTPREMADRHEAAGHEGRHWTRMEALKHPLFWAFVPGVLTPSFIGTAVFFQAPIVADAVGMPLLDYVVFYGFYSVTSVIAAVITGMIIDRYSAFQCLPWYLSAMAVATILFSIEQSPWTAALMMMLLGLNAGAASTVHVAIWAESYGAHHVGAIKALGHAMMVFASALGPGVTGFFLDQGINFAEQCFWMGLWTALVCIWYATFVFGIGRHFGRHSRTENAQSQS